MSPEARRVATLVFLSAVDLPANRRVGVSAGTLVMLLRALFAEDRRADLAERLRREDRLDAAEQRIDALLGEADARKQANDRRPRRGRRTPRMTTAPPTQGHPGESQGNLLFPPPTAASDVDWPSPAG
jgi:hypothetical protein